MPPKFFLALGLIILTGAVSGCSDKTSHEQIFIELDTMRRPGQFKWYKCSIVERNGPMGKLKCEDIGGSVWIDLETSDYRKPAPNLK